MAPQGTFRPKTSRLAASSIHLRFKGEEKCFARVLQPIWALETLAEQGGAASVLARPQLRKVKSQRQSTGGQVRFIISRAAHEVIIDSQQSSPLCTGAMESGRSLRDSFARDTPAQLWLLPEPEF